jgi:hypothetical protein
MAEQNPSTTAPRDGLRDRFWFQALVVVAIVAGIALIASRSSHRDVVQNWLVIAACPAEAGTAPNTVSTTLDTSDCATTPSHSVSGRGWPIVPFVLPASAGLDPAITNVHSDSKTRVLSVEYGSDAATDSGTGVVIVFVEVPPSDIPEVPYTIKGASGAVTVTTPVAS